MLVPSNRLYGALFITWAVGVWLVRPDNYGPWEGTCTASCWAVTVLVLLAIIVGILLFVGIFAMEQKDTSLTDPSFLTTLACAVLNWIQMGIMLQLELSTTAGVFVSLLSAIPLALQYVYLYFTGRVKVRLGSPSQGAGPTTETDKGSGTKVM